MELTERQSKLIVNSAAQVFRTLDSGKLSAQAYRFITQHMDHIAHYDLHGFQSTYRDVRDLARSLQTSEYRDDPEHMMAWANELDRRYALDSSYRGGGQPPIVTGTIRALVALGQKYSGPLRSAPAYWT